MELWTAFVLGLAGSLHCAGMCGPLALALPVPDRRLPAYLLGRLAYNFGRVVTYGSLGLLFGMLGGFFVLAGFQQAMSIGLGLAVLLGLVFSRRLARWVPTVHWIKGLQGHMAWWLGRRSVAALGILGVLNGFLPCGLVYVACAGAVATGSALKGAEYMAMFGAGTVPLMLAMSLSGSLVPLRLRWRLTKAIPFAVGLVAALLILRGMSLGIPFISPNLSGSGATCCQE